MLMAIYSSMYRIQIVSDETAIEGTMASEILSGIFNYTKYLTLFKI